MRRRVQDNFFEWLKENLDKEFGEVRRISVINDDFIDKVVSYCKNPIATLSPRLKRAKRYAGYYTGGDINGDSWGIYCSPYVGKSAGRDVNKIFIGIFFAGFVNDGTSFIMDESSSFRSLDILEVIRELQTKSLPF